MLVKDCCIYYAVQVTTDTDNSTPAYNKIESENCFESKLAIFLVTYIIYDAYYICL